MRFAIWPMLVAGILALGAGASSQAARSGRYFHDATAGGAPLPSVPRESSREAVVIGSDERIAVADTTIFPFSAIAFLELSDAGGEVFGSCTGTFIGPDSLLTAGHCLWDTGQRDWLSAHIRVVPAKDGDFEPFGAEYASDWWVADAFAESGDPNWDWGIVKLPNDLLTSDTGWMTVIVADTATLSGSAFSPAIVGYPSDKPVGTMWGLIRPSFAEVLDFLLLYDIDTAPGQSGAAIWSAEEGPNLGRIVGIHTQGGPLNFGSRIDHELLDDLFAGCSVMGCAIATGDAPPQPTHPQPAPDPTPEPVPEPAPLPSLPFRSYGVAISRD